MKKQELRRVRMDWTPNGAIFTTSDMEPLVEGEEVKFDPENGGFYPQPYDENRAVVGTVGKILSISEPYKALGEGNTYEEQRANSRMVRHQSAQVGQAEIKASGYMLHTMDNLHRSISE